MKRLRGRTAIVTGAARGMGASHARLLVGEGARVVIADVLDAEGTALAEELGRERAVYAHLDVTDYSQWEETVRVAETAFGGVDVLVNNAGILNAGAIEDFPLDAWDAIVAVNLTGVFYGIRAAVPALRRAGGGSIINVSSTAGFIGYAQLPGHSATKSGVRGLTKSAALELGRYGIRVNSIHPGVVETDMQSGMSVRRDDPALGRGASPIEISRLVAFLASDDSSFSTGAEFIADGGRLAGTAISVASN